MTGRERRDYYRIEDRAALEIALLDSCVPSHDNLFPFKASEEPFALAGELLITEHESQALLRTINDQDRHTANYLRNIDKRIQLLSKMLCTLAAKESKLTYYDISLSEGGFSFNSSTEYKQGQFLAVKLILQPSFAGVICTAQVVECKALDKEFRTSLNFEVLSDVDKTLLGKHVIQFQAQQRRQQLDTGH